MPQTFTINVAQPVLDDLQERLARTRFPDEVENAGWDYGTHLAYLKELVTYWRDDYDWRKQEAMLNRFAHFTTQIDGRTVHFIHERGKGENPVPLLLLHGWPDSFYRFYKLIPMLTDPARFGGDGSICFDVIVPSLPGFGFSEKPLQRGGVDVPAMLHTLMTDILGYERYGAHGGDTGSPLAKQIAERFPEAVIGIHLSDLGWDVTLFLDPEMLSAAEKDYVKAVESWSYSEGAYATIQGTKPQSLAYGLTDSPTGLAAWIVEKFHTWSDHNGNLDDAFTKDELLTNIMIYWVTDTLNSSIRWYYDGMNGDWGEDGGEWGEASEWEQPEIKTGGVPVGVALFPKELPGMPPPREMGERVLNIQRWTPMPKGGHFAALEQPALMAEDLRAFFSDIR